mmetsp:Transcript_36552/g.85930  ORF Transcript_36552/g.85930 Transcript_36552/m.85930 type:complete len:343 (-) Transcript_36552:233-1261(-)
MSSDCPAPFRAQTMSMSLTATPPGRRRLRVSLCPSSAELEPRGSRLDHTTGSLLRGRRRTDRGGFLRERLKEELGLAEDGLDVVARGVDDVDVEALVGGEIDAALDVVLVEVGVLGVVEEGDLLQPLRLEDALDGAGAHLLVAVEHGAVRGPPRPLLHLLHGVCRHHAQPALGREFPLELVLAPHVRRPQAPPRRLVPGLDALRDDLVSPLQAVLLHVGAREADEGDRVREDGRRVEHELLKGDLLRDRRKDQGEVEEAARHSVHNIPVLVDLVRELLRDPVALDIAFVCVVPSTRPSHLLDTALMDLYFIPLFRVNAPDQLKLLGLSVKPGQDKNFLLGGC